MANFEIRAQGQIKHWVNGGVNDDADWVNCARFLNDADGTPGRQLRLKFLNPAATIPDSPALHAAFSIKQIAVQISLAYILDDAGAILQAIDAIEFAAFRVVTGRTGTYAFVPGFKENIPNAMLMAFFGLGPDQINNMNVPIKASVPMPSLSPNAQGYLGGYGRRMIATLSEPIAVGANAGFEIQAKTFVQNRGLEYDVVVTGTV